MNIKSLIIVGLMLVLLAFSASAAVDAQILNAEFDGTDLDPSVTTEVYSFEKGNVIDLRVQIKAINDVDDVQIEAYIRGDDHDLIEDITSVFSMKAGRTYTKHLELEFKDRMERDEYLLRIEVAGRRGDTLVETYTLAIDSDRHDVTIRDVILSPSNGVQAGRALLATVRVQNYGETDEDDVRVTFSIPELGLSATDYIDELEADGEDDDSKSTEELYLRIPTCADAGVYDAVVEVSYHDGDKTTRKTMPVEVIGDDTCYAGDDSDDRDTGRAVVTIGPESQDLARGSSVIYPVTITNDGAAKTYAVSVIGGEWGTFRVSPSNVVTVGNDETKTVYIHASANKDANAGMQVFGVEIQSGDKVMNSVTLKANVTGGSSSVDLKRALEIGLIVLVVILVILGLIIGFNKLREDDDEKGESETYY